MVGADSQNGATAAAAEAAEAYTHAERISRIMLINGVVLDLKPVPPLLVNDAARRIPRPEIPMVWIEAKDANEENPGDPEYLQRVLAWQAECDEAAINVALIMGTSLAECPEDMHRPETDDWIDEIEATYAAIEMEPPAFDRDSQSARWLAWLRYYGMRAEEDIVRLSKILTSAVAVSQEDVRAAVDSFRDRVRRTTDLENAVHEIAANRDRERAEAAGDGEPVGGEGGGSPQPDPMAGVGEPAV